MIIEYTSCTTQTPLAIITIMIYSNTTKNLTIKRRDNTFRFYSYGELIGVFYEDTNSLTIYANWLYYSQTTCRHIAQMVGFCVYYYGERIIQTYNEWCDIKIHSPSIRTIRKMLDNKNNVTYMGITLNKQIY